MERTKESIIAERCINWMHDVIECHLDEDTGLPQFDGSEEAIEDAEFIIECINLYMLRRIFGIRKSIRSLIYMGALLLRR